MADLLDCSRGDRGWLLCRFVVDADGVTWDYESAGRFRSRARLAAEIRRLEAAGYSVDLWPWWSRKGAGRAD